MMMMLNTNREFVQQFLDLSLVSLSETERDDLHRSLRTYQRTHDLAQLAKACSPMLRNTDRARLLHFIRAPMMMPERLQFDRLLGIHSRSDRLTPLQLDVYSSKFSATSQCSGPERYVTIQGSRGKTMGFSIRGGSEFGLGIFVSAVHKKSPSGEAGLLVGDQILLANGVDFSCVANSSAVKVLSSSAILHLRIQRCGKVPEWKIAKQRVLWYDVALCKIVRNPPVTESQNLRSTFDGIVEQKVIISVSDNTDHIGLNIRGGLEYGVGIYVSRVDPGGLAHKAGISSGDQIVKVNDVSFERIEHSDAIDVLRSSSNLIATIRSVGKYPVFKELCAEYTWSGVGNVHLNSATSSELGKLKIQRTRARESSIDLTAYSLNGNGNQAYEHSDVEELDDGLQVQAELFYPKDDDIIFRRNYEDSWKQIDFIDDDHIRADFESKTWSADYTDSLGHYIQDSEMSDSNMDYTSFLEKHNKEMNGQNSKASLNSEPNDKHLVIETVIEEDVTSFSTRPQSSTSDHSVSIPVKNSYLSNQHDVIAPSQGSVRSGADSSINLSPISPKSNAHENSFNNRKISTKSTRAPDIPSTASSSNTVANGNGDANIDNIASQIKQLEARKSHLGTWEITRVAGSSSSSLPSSPETTSDSDRSKSSWSTLKKKIKGSLKSKGPKKRLSLPSEAEFIGRDSSKSPSSLHQKGVFERSFGSQILNNQVTERYNLMAVLEDHARKILTEDECKAVLRHINNYHENKDLERLVQLLLAILDKEEKQILLIDVRGVVYPSHLDTYDMIMDRCHIRGYNTSNWTRTDVNSVEPVIVQKQPAPLVPTKTETNKVNDVQDDAKKSECVTFSKDDFKNEPEHLELIILEKDDRMNVVIPRNNGNEGYEDFDGVETVYISKHKSSLGLELCGGKEDPVDTVIRVKDVHPGSAASDDRRIQPGIEITEIDGKSTRGLSQQEAEAVLNSSFQQKSPVNLGIEIRHSYHL